MHIGLVSLDYPSNRGGAGVANQVRTLSQALVRLGYEVTVVTLAQSGCPSYSWDRGVRVVRARRSNLHWYASKVPQLGGLFALVIREWEDSQALYNQLRVVHRSRPFQLIEGTETGMLAVALRMRGVPFIIRLHGERYTVQKHTPGLGLSPGLCLSRVMQRVAMRRAQVLIAPSVAHAHEIGLELGYDRPRIVVVRNALDFSDLEESPTEITCGTFPLADRNRFAEAPVVLYVGRLDRCKGVTLLLKAAQRVVEEIPQVQFALAGAAHPSLPTSELIHLVTQLSLQEHVHFLGEMSTHELAACYRRATISVLPSYYETFGLAALEAMASGIPVVATSVGGLPEVVEDGKTGLLVRPGDGSGLASAMIHLLQNPDLRSQLGAAGQHRAVTGFSMRQHIKATLSLYEAAIAGQNLHNPSPSIS